MADLRQRLARLAAASPEDAAAPAAEPVGAPVDARLEKLRDLIRRTTDRTASRKSEQSTAPPRVGPLQGLPADRRETPHGPIYVVDQYLQPHHCHGTIPIARALGVAPATLAKLALDESLTGVDPTRMLLLDTETTGLAGGTGTIPFLVGLAWFEDQSLRVHQLLLEQPGNEAPMLRVLAERLAWASVLVTFNGKAYDWPLLRTRCVLNRVEITPSLAHLDLLHCARRIFKRRLSSVRLVELEAAVLGAPREFDIDGAEIPGLYFDYLRGADGSVLAPVIDHNGKDLVALAALLVRLGEHFDAPRAADDPRDHLGFAEVAERAADFDRARRFADAVSDGGADGAVAVRAHAIRARMARRAGDVSAEERALREALEAADTDETRAWAHLALAKLYEHRVKDTPRALEHARYTAPAEGDEAQTRRLERLQARASRAADL